MGRDESESKRVMPLLPPPPTVSSSQSNRPIVSAADPLPERAEDIEDIDPVDADELLEWDGEAPYEDTGGNDVIELDAEMLDEFVESETGVGEAELAAPDPDSDAAVAGAPLPTATATPTTELPDEPPVRRAPTPAPWQQRLRDVHPRTLALVGAGLALAVVLVGLALRDDPNVDPSDEALVRRDGAASAHNDGQHARAAGAASGPSTDRDSPAGEGPAAGIEPSGPSAGVLGGDSPSPSVTGASGEDVVSGAGPIGADEGSTDPAAQVPDGGASLAPKEAHGPGQGGTAPNNMPARDRPDDAVIPTETALDLLKRARAAETSKQYAQAFQLATQSHQVQSSYEALEVMVRSACQLDDRKKARAALRELPLGRRAELRAACRVAD